MSIDYSLLINSEREIVFSSYPPVLGIAVFLGGILLQDRRDGDSQLRILRELALPLIIAVDVRESHDRPALQDQKPVVDTGLIRRASISA